MKDTMTSFIQVMFRNHFVLERKQIAIRINLLFQYIECCKHQHRDKIGKGTENQKIEKILVKICKINMPPKYP